MQGDFCPWEIVKYVLEDIWHRFILPRPPPFPMVKNDFFEAGWDETNFYGRDQDREIRLMKIHYETETEKTWRCSSHRQIGGF